MPEAAARARPVGYARLRRARAWLRVAFFVQGALIVYLTCSVVGGSVRSTALAVAALVLAVAPLVVLLWRERRSPVAGKPADWTARGLATVPAHGVGAGVVLAGPLTPTGSAAWNTVAIIAVVVSVVEIVPVVLAGRAVLRPLSSDLADVGIEIRVKIRSSGAWSPSWLAQDDVRLTDESLIIMIRPGPTWAYAIEIALVEIRRVEVRPVSEQDGSWFRTAEGHVRRTPPGDVVVIRHRRGTQILPVYEPAGFAEVLRARSTDRNPNRSLAADPGVDSGET